MKVTALPETTLLLHVYVRIQRSKSRKSRFAGDSWIPRLPSTPQSQSSFGPDHFHQKVAGRRTFLPSDPRATMSRYPTFGGNPLYPYDRGLLAGAPSLTREDRQVCVA